MKEPIKFGFVLLLFCALSAGLLSVVNSFTSPVIAATELKETLRSYEAIYGDQADNFEELDEGELAKITEKVPEVKKVFIAKKGQDVVGYGINISANGFGGEMQNAIGFLTQDDKIAGFRNISNGETKGYGTQIEEEPYYSSYEGKSAKGKLKIEKDPKNEDEVLWISGATVSSKAVLESDNLAVDVYNKYLKTK